MNVITIVSVNSLHDQSLFPLIPHVCLHQYSMALPAVGIYMEILGDYAARATTVNKRPQRRCRRPLSR